MEHVYRTHKGKKVNAKSADGQEGYLLRDARGWCFRIYTSEDKAEFIDYRLAHMDLHIEINDESAYFYSDSEGNRWLDYSPRILAYSFERKEK